MNEEREDIRLRIAGIYIENGKILLVQHRKNNKEYYLLPGGGQHTGETSREALIREWKEELNLDIVPGDFIFSGESIPPDINKRKHVYQMVFLIESISGDLRLHTDNTLVGQAWVEIEKLGEIILYPHCIDQILEAVSGTLKSPYQVYHWND